MEKEILRQISKPIFYVTNDVSRAIGLEKILPNYHIVCLDDHPLVTYLLKEGVSVFCLERELGRQNEIARNAGTILSHPLVLSFIKEESKKETPNILFFKPQKRIELIAKKFGFNLIGNSINLSRIFEDKISFLNICLDNHLKIAPGEIYNLNDIRYSDLIKRFGNQPVIQFGRGWAGNSTYFLRSEDELEKIKKENGNIEIRASRFINGITVLNNAVIYGENTFTSGPAVQIKAEQILTSTQGGTGGRQWPAKLNQRQEEEIKAITLATAKVMRRKGYRGIFGLDFLIEEASGEVYLSENNARITASVPFYTKLELGKDCLPLLGFHLLSFLGGKEIEFLNHEPPPVSGGEIVARNNLQESVQVGGEIKNGIYTKDLDFVRESYFLDTDKNEEIWLETAAKGRKVNPEIELIKIDTPGSVCDEKGNLGKDYLKIISSLKEKLALK